MFTLRVEWTRCGQTEYSVHECNTYQRQQRAADGRTVITMDQDTSEPRELLLEGDQVVYVMNQQGNTIDTIRTKRRPPT